MPSEKLAPGDILVVDDRIENLELLKEMLMEDGHHVRPVTSGKMALSAIKERLPDLVLLDVGMPKMSGFEVCRTLKQEEKYAELPIIFITALQDAEDKLLAFQIGGSDYITKPFNLEEVKARVRTHLRIHRLREKLRAQNRELEASHERLLKLEQLRDNLTHMIIHDLRSPLSAMVGSLRLMQEDAASQDGRVETADLARAQSNAARLIRMVNDLLDIGRLEAEQLDLELGEVSWAELLRAVLYLLGAEKAERVKVSVDPTTTIEGDGKLLERVLLNLLDNAFKYSPEKSPVEVSARLDKGEWVLVVSDQGIGIPDEFKTKVFDKFGQVDARRARLPSTGLGLTFCSLAIRAHGGSIVAEDRTGGGTQMVVRLPERAKARAGQTSARAL